MEKKKHGYPDVEQSISNIKHFCSYQERCHQEVRERLYSYGLYTEDVEEIIAMLISENYLNEARFAIHYAGGKFRIKGWGKNKIRMGLKQKQITPNLILKALSEIDDEPYRLTFKKQALKKWEELRGEKNIFTKKSKLKNFMLQRGFESDLIYDFLKEK